MAVALDDRVLAAAGYHTVAVDQRGHGRSDKPLDGYDIAQLSRRFQRRAAGRGDALPLEAANAFDRGLGLLDFLPRA